MAGKQAKQQNLVEEPKPVESLEQVDDVSEAELKAVDEEIQKQKEQASTSPVTATLASQGNSGYRTIQEIEADLSKPIHPKFLRQLKFGAAKGATYVPWPIVQKYLSHFAPGWETTSTGFSTPVGATIITHLTIPTATGKVTRVGHGFEAHQTTNSQGITKDTGFGGASIIASRQAFKRASVEFGLGKDLYPA